MSGGNAPRFTIEYDNDTGPDDGGFWEWWSVFDNGRCVAKCDTEEDAKRVLLALLVVEKLDLSEGSTL
jgi:hypothetical protein